MPNIILNWKGKDYTIPEKKTFRLVREVEEVATIGELAGMERRQKLGQIAEAFGVMLRFAGCKVSDREIYSEMMRQMKMSDEPTVAANAIQSLLTVLMDGAPESGNADEGEAPEKT